MRRVFFTIYILIAAFFAFSGISYGAESVPDSLITYGDLCHSKYDFEGAITAYGEALEFLEASDADSLKVLSLKDKILLSENGKNMKSFAYSPVVVARRRFSLEDFFLYYPLPDGSWRNLPNQLDSASAQGPVRATYVHEDS